MEDELDGLMSVLEDVLRLIAAAEVKDNNCTTWQLRAHLASAILDLVMIDTEVRKYGDHSIIVVQAKFHNLQRPLFTGVCMKA